jgi:hypothetical protein
MRTKGKLPKEYSPFQELIICSNRFTDGVVPLEVNKNVVLLVGQGDHPSIWLSVPRPSKSDEQVHIVKNNQALHGEFVITFLKDTTVVSLGKTVLLRAEKLSDQKAEVTEMDFRPIGLNIYGDKNGLYVGTNLLAGNTFVNVHTMIAIGD